ncbi:sugar ABC transporter permease [Metabacillus sp. GX 13764]|uniref:carbohydrate ABC transporter permease n=1 Tax=Metabacillus kandeliae TaxID=2900151 RepID=UPI001E3125A1|nr:sugar ABC transporter permease [Metabacillus kandeliae]MCD7034050.1 sugar ABC transporter permease [Metabacillus kandeliae]
MEVMPPKLNKEPAPKTKKKPKSRTQKTGYVLVAPSLILILVIAIWPVIQSFYYSLFDLRLNEPTKSTTTFEYRLDLNRYLNTFPFLISGLDNEIKKGHAADQLTDMKDRLEAIDSNIQSNPETKKKYDSINDKLLNFESINPNEAIASIDSASAKKLISETTDITAKLKAVNAETKLDQGSKLIGLSQGMSQVMQEPNFIGFKNYANYLTGSRTWHALGNTLFFTVVSVGVELVIGLGIALLINKAFFGRGLIRATILIPWAIPTAVSALMWKFLYDGQNGIVAKIFETLHLVPDMANLLTTAQGAMFSVIFTDVWKTTPYMALLLLAGLQTIPASLYEAASIDGATKWKQFTKITLPLLKSSLLVALLFRTLDAFRVFDLIYVLTGGGPANSTETISSFAYQVMFSQQKFGEGSTISVIVFVFVAIISMIYIKFLGRDLLNDGK